MCYNILKHVNVLFPFNVILKPCPFCGGNVYLVSGVAMGIAMIVCDHCGATVSFLGREFGTSAADAYNKRLNNDE